MKKRILIVTPIVVVLGAVVWVILWAQAPSQGRVAPILLPNKMDKTHSLEELDGTYISFQHRGGYDVRRESPSNNDLERHTLTASSQYNKQILASVVNLPEGQLKSHGDYIYRQKSTNTYTSRKFQAGENVINIWVKTDGTEQTAMVARGDKAAVLSIVTAPGANDDMTAEMDALLNTLEWRQ